MNGHKRKKLWNTDQIPGTLKSTWWNGSYASSMLKTKHTTTSVGLGLVREMTWSRPLNISLTTTLTETRGDENAKVGRKTESSEANKHLDFSELWHS